MKSKLEPIQNTLCIECNINPKMSHRNICYKCFYKKLQKYNSKASKTAKIRNISLKEEVIRAYSPKCKCQSPSCAVNGGMSDIRALSIDHINGGGSKQKRDRIANGDKRSIYSILKALGYPEGYQVLCMNCQFIKAIEKGEQ